MLRQPVTIAIATALMGLACTADWRGAWPALRAPGAVAAGGAEHAAHAGATAGPAAPDTVRAHSVPLCDVVLVGDSHMRQGVIPSVLATALNGARITHDARPGMPLSPEFLRAAAATLDPQSPLRCLVIGVSLTTQKATLRHRRAEFSQRTPALAGVEHAAAQAWPSQLTPYEPPARPPAVRVSTLHPDGWRERDFTERRDPHASTVEEHWNLLAHPFDRMMIGANRAALAQLAATGVRVVIFALPSDTGAIEPLTEQWAGMTALDYARRICPPGGEVLELAFQPGDTYDGHHLHPGAARRVSEELAVELTRAPATPPAPPAPPSAADGPPR